MYFFFVFNLKFLKYSMSCLIITKNKNFRFIKIPNFIQLSTSFIMCFFILYKKFLIFQHCHIFILTTFRVLIWSPYKKRLIPAQHFKCFSFLKCSDYIITQSMMR